MRSVCGLFVASALLCADASANVQGRCVRWLAMGVVGFSTLLTPPDPLHSVTTPSLAPVGAGDVQRVPWREYRALGPDGASPRPVLARFFDRSFGHRSVARLINRAAVEETEAPWRHRLDAEADYLTVELRSLALWRKPHGFQIGWVMPTQEVQFPQVVPEDVFHSGEPFTVAGMFQRKARLGEAKGTFTLVVRFDLRTQRLVVERAHCHMSVSSVLGNFEDETTLGPATFAVGSDDRPPLCALEAMEPR